MPILFNKYGVSQVGAGVVGTAVVGAAVGVAVGVAVVFGGSRKRYADPEFDPGEIWPPAPEQQGERLN